MFRLLSLFPAFSFLLTGALAPIAAGSFEPAAKEQRVACAVCHFSSRDISHEDIEPAESSEATACIGCHPGIVRGSGTLPRGSGRVYPGHIVSVEPGWRTSAPLGGKTFDRLDCLTCHVPHSQVQRKQLRLDKPPVRVPSISVAYDSVTQLCLYCHPVAGEFEGSGRGYVRHPIGIPLRKPGRKVDDPRFPPLIDVRGTPDVSDDVIGCTTCHYVHTVSYPFLLRWGGRELSAACLMCHPEVSPATARGLERPHGLSLDR
ncbi:MAG: hypothetical protein HY695_13950 [Deltaproteobacteria bacterium]|nr:hypothetical protein [Deltaproteobacteria bacterium]